MLKLKFKLKILLKIIGFHWRKFLGREAILAYQEKQFRKLLLHAFDKSPFYKKLYTEHGIKREDLPTIPYDNLPIVNKDMLKENIDDVFTNRHLHLNRIESWLQNHPDPSDVYYKNFLIVHTSGSTSGVFFNVYSFDDIIPTLACFAARVLVSADQKSNVVFYGAIEGHYTGISLANLSKMLNLKVISISVLEPIDEVVKKLNELQPIRLIAYGSSYVELLHQAKIGKLKINPQYLNVSGDGITDEARKQIHSTWNNSTLINNYICTEAMLIATDKEGGREFDVFEDHTKLNIYDPETLKMCEIGEMGNILITNLNNFTTPIIRYHMEDQGTLLEFKESSPFSRLQLSEARISISAIVSDKNNKEVKIPPSVLVEFFVKGLISYQFIFISKTEAIIKYTAKKNLDAEIKKAFLVILNKVNATEDFIIKPEKVSLILPEENGKTPSIKVL